MRESAEELPYAPKKMVYLKPGEARRRLRLWLLVWFSDQGDKSYER
jgi:hypothetical protein